VLYPLSYVGLAGHRILRLRPWRGHSHLTRPPVRLGCMTTIPTYDQFHHPSSNGEDEMSQTGDWSPDEPLGTETFEQGDDAIDEKTELDPSFLEAVELDPSLDPTLQVDDRELEEAGAEFDDPEAMVTLDGGMDDPDGLGLQPDREAARSDDHEGWDLDAPETSAEGD